MCGIAGYISFKNIDEPLLDKMQSAISHRGPDQKSTYQYENTAFAHVRLSIVDLSVNGMQPMHDNTGKYTIIFNGEIYNHLSIRNDLIKRGYQFQSTSDTETLLYGYIEFGEKILNKLNGIFAFAILDKNKNEVFIARDQMGVKPLYFYHKNNIILFSSELKAICQYSQLDKTLDHQSLMNYITFLWSPGDKTPFKHIRKILPGYFIKINTINESVIEKKYYDVPFDGNRIQNESNEDIILHTEQLLFDAVERQMMSDVPVGFFVSGGIDSSLIAVISKMLYPTKEITAFTIDSGGDEIKKEGFSHDLDYAKLLSKKYEFNLNIIESKIDILHDFDRMIWHLDEPQADSAPLSVYNISKGARDKGIKVLLGGAAGDDLFSGYRRHQALSIEKWLPMIPNEIKHLIKYSTNKLDTSNPFNRRLKKFANDLEKTKYDRMVGYFSWIQNATAYNLFNESIKPELSTYNPQDYLLNLLNNIPAEHDDLNKILYLELRSFLVDHNLNYTDKMSMAVGVESRVPYLDMELVNYSTKLPIHLKMQKTQTKHILKKISEKYLPSEIINRPKAGFGAPVRKWITSDMKEMIEDKLSYKRLNDRGIFNPDKVWNLINDNKNLKIDSSYSIWSLLAIESWIEQFVDGKKLF